MGISIADIAKQAFDGAQNAFDRVIYDETLTKVSDDDNPDRSDYDVETGEHVSSESGTYECRVVKIKESEDITETYELSIGQIIAMIEGLPEGVIASVGDRVTFNDRAWEIVFVNDVGEARRLFEVALERKNLPEQIQ